MPQATSVQTMPGRGKGRARPKGTRGSFRQAIPRENISDASVSDLKNPFNFYRLLDSENGVLMKWLQTQNLLPTSCDCNACGAPVTKIGVHSDRIDKYSFRCKCTNSMSVRGDSFFSKSHLTLPDAMVFINSYVVQELPLIDCAELAGVNYSSTGPEWGGFMKEVFKEYFHRDVNNMVFRGEVEVDESMFGRRMKHHRGEKKGMNVWVVGLVERATNRVIMYPVEDRSEDTMKRIIQKHVERGSSVYTDGWAAYNWMNDAGYNHFNVSQIMKSTN